MVHFYVFYLISGLLKSFLKFYSLKLPFDITLLSAGVVLFIFILKAYKMSMENRMNLKVNRNLLIPIGSLLLFYSWMVFSNIYTCAPGYGKEKTIFFLMNIFAFSIPLIFTDEEVIQTLKMWIIASTMMGIVFIFYFGKNIIGLMTYAQFGSISKLYLGLPEVLGLNVILLIASKRKVFTSIFYRVLFLSVNIVITMLCGGRGPILFVVAILALYITIQATFFLLNQAKTRFKSVTKYLVASTTIIAIIVVVVNLFFYEQYNELYNRTFDRLENMFVVLGMIEEKAASTVDNSTNVRVLYYEFSIDKIISEEKIFFVGAGIGSFMQLYYGLDKKGYPHNIILEIWIEMGIVGVILFVIFAFLSLKSSRNSYCIYVALFILLNTLKSSSLVDIRIFFAILALSIIDYDRVLINEC